MLNRREFVRSSALAAGALITGPHLASAMEDMVPYKLTILHTNDTHSRLEAFPMDGSRNQGMGGIAGRSELIRQIRAQEAQVLLFDAGDIFQGTPFFNIYKGEPEIKAMSAMGYDACTIGNHDFDAGMENLATQLSRHAKFPMLVSNYDLNHTPMEGKTLPYKVFKKGKLRIGVFGLGIEGQGLIPDNLFGNTVYQDPIIRANEISSMLITKEKCDMVICLSHLGYQYKTSNKVSDEVLARESKNIDLIIGGHTHTFFEKPLVFQNKNGDDVVVNQVGWAGIILGRLDFEFTKFSGKKLVKNHNIFVSQKSGG